MKKLLALVLALVMTLSLCVVSSNAAYKDAADVDYKEAVDVLTAVGVFVGDGSGNFYPDQNLTRAQAAKVISYLLLGQKVADGIQGSGTVFTDVAASHWAVGYIEYCASVGVLAGIGDGKFDPNGQLTGLAFAKMLLVALGYDATYEGYTGANWSINVAKKATDLELFDGNDDIVMSAVVTRQEAAQYAFNALQTQTVTAKKGATMNVNGVTVVTSGEAAELNTGDTKNYANATGDGAAAEIAKLYLCEKLYGKKLVLKTEVNDAGKQVNVWYYNKTDATKMDKADKVGTYVTEAADKTIVATKDGKSLAYWIESVSKDYAKDAYTVVLNGNNSTAADVQIGAEINLYVTDGELVKVIVNTYDIAKVEKVTAVTNKDFTHTVKLGATTYPSDKLPGFDADTMVKDSYVQVLYKLDTTATVLEVKVPETVTGKITATGSDYIKVDGTKYTTVAAPDDVDADDTYDVYLVNGYVYGGKLVEDAKTTDGFVYVLEAAAQAQDGGALGIGGKDAIVRVKVAYMDGTQATLDMPVVKATADITVEGTAASGGNTINKDDYYVTICGTKYEVCNNKVGNAAATTLQNKFFNYSLDEDGKITLKALDGEKESAIMVNETATNGIKKDEVSFKDQTLVTAKTYTVNSATKLVVIDTNGKKVGEFTGYKNFPSTEILNKAALVLHAKNSTLATTIYVIDTTTYTTATYAYYTGDKETVGGKTFYDFYVNGELKSYELNSAPTGGKVFTINESGKTATPAENAYTTIVNEVDDSFFTDAAKAAKQYSDKVKVWDVSVDDVVSAGTIAEGDSVLYVTSDEKVAVVFVLENIVKDQPETKVELEGLYDAASKTAWAGVDMSTIVTLGLAQTQDGSTLYISGTMDADKVFSASTTEFKAGQAAAVAKFGYADLAALKATMNAPATSTKVGFINLKVNGENTIYIVGNATETFNVTFGTGNNAVTVTVDVTGLAW